jgi:fructose-1,6-bisphosphatase/inositol monophosphatase family enzyme
MPQLKAKTSPLCDRITQPNAWAYLQQAAIQTATTGGMTAMGFYRQPLAWPALLSPTNREDKNPSTLADLQATAQMLQTLQAALIPLCQAEVLACNLSYLAEETKYLDWFQHHLPAEIIKNIQAPEQFFSHPENVLRVIIDGIDGTGSFTRGLPLFCSAVAILVDDQPRVAAIYDPIHHIVYSAALMGPYLNPTALVEAWAWHVATGNRVDLAAQAAQAPPKALAEEAIGIHLTRSKPNRPLRKVFLGVHSPTQPESMLERLADAAAAIYAINTGLVAMADVARGALGGFVNIVTNLWDVTAGEVLVQACGGYVTGFNGQPINYSASEQVSLVAAKAHLHTQIIEILRAV